MRLALLATMNTLQAILIACLCIVPQSPAVLSDSVATLEVNNFYDLDGRLVFTQLIGWQENETVQFWRMVKGNQQRPMRDWANGGYRVTFLDGDEMRTITAESFRETWTQVDVEVENRELLPKEKRETYKPLTSAGVGEHSLSLKAN